MSFFKYSQALFTVEQINTFKGEELNRQTHKLVTRASLEAWLADLKDTHDNKKVLSETKNCIVFGNETSTMILNITETTTKDY